MKAKKYWILSVIVITVCVGGLLAKTTVRQRAVLAGLKGVYVMVESLTLDGKEAGLTKEQIRTDVELKLRLAGIKVLPKEKALAIKGEPYLYIRANALRVETLLLYCGSIEVSLCERVVLIRDPNTATFGRVWHESSIVLSGSNVVKEHVRENIKDLVDEFINDYLAANPKEQAKTKNNK